MSMTRKDYELVARILKMNLENNPNNDAVQEIIYNFVGAFRAYPNYNEATFRDACGVK